MIGRYPGALLIAAVLAGCGSGSDEGESDVATGASPAAPDQTQPAEGPPSTSSPAGSPAAQIGVPTAPGSSEGKRPAARALGAPIRGRDLSQMLRTDTLSPRGGGQPVEVSPIANGAGLPIYVYQTGSYSFVTGYRFEGRSPNVVFRALEIEVLTSYVNDGVSFNGDLVARSGEQTTRLIASSAQVNQDAALPMGASVHEWRSPVAGEPWFARLQLQEHEGNRIRVCWQVLLPAVERLACHVYSEAADRIVGAYVVDESPRTGRQLFQAEEPVGQ